MTKVRHLLGISGGKDSAALAIYMKNKYLDLDIEYYTTDTGKELDETYELISNLEIYLGKKITKLTVTEDEENHGYDPFDYLLQLKYQYLPSTQARWCTQNLKLVPFEKFVGNDPVISYVGIRGDENREGYISRKPNIQSIFPFRTNIWSEDVITKALSNSAIPFYQKLIADKIISLESDFMEALFQPISLKFSVKKKMDFLLYLSTPSVNKLIFEYLKTTNYPLASELTFSLLDNEDNLVKEDIFRILRESGVGVPKYYNKVPFEINGKKGEYSRSRSGCFFCFFQQKIEWVWLFEQHPELFEKAKAYEKDGYNWNEHETLIELARPDRVARIKEDYLKKEEAKNNRKKSNKLLDILEDFDDDEIGCAACFI